MGRSTRDMEPMSVDDLRRATRDRRPSLPDSRRFGALGARTRGETAHVSGSRMASASRQVPWRRLALYYAFALAVALPFNLGWAATWLESRFPGSPLALWPFIPAALGPALAPHRVCRLVHGVAVEGQS